MEVIWACVRSVAGKWRQKLVYDEIWPFCLVHHISHTTIFFWKSEYDMPFAIFCLAWTWTSVWRTRLCILPRIREVVFTVSNEILWCSLKLFWTRCQHCETRGGHTWSSRHRRLCAVILNGQTSSYANFWLHLLANEGGCRRVVRANSAVIYT